VGNPLGITSFAYFWGAGLAGEARMTPWSLLDRAVDLGLDVLQICDNVPMLDWSAVELEELRVTAGRRGVTLEVGASTLDVEYLRAHLEIAHALDAHLLRVVPHSGSEQQQKLRVDDLCAVLDKLVPFCREHDIVLAVENYFDLSDDDLLQTVRRMDDEHVGICLDTANSTGFLERPEETARALAPHVVSLHLKDYVVTKHPGVGYRITGAPLGEGWLDARAVLDAIERAGREPNVLLELWMYAAETEAETVRREDEWVRQSVAYAQKGLGLGTSERTRRS
jgi:sugar phosphate isomerase/epimerase